MSDLDAWCRYLLFTLHPSTFTDFCPWRPLWAGNLRSLDTFQFRAISSILKTYLRSTMWQNRLCSLTFILGTPMSINHCEQIWNGKHHGRSEFSKYVSDFTRSNILRDVSLEIITVSLSVRIFKRFCFWYDVSTFVSLLQHQDVGALSNFFGQGRRRRCPRAKVRKCP